MPITTIVAPPPRDGTVTQEAYSNGFDLTLQTMKQAVDDINANASQYNVATSTTSTSSVLIGTGSKTFTVPAALGFVIGMTLRIANTSANFMTGEVTSYTSTTLVMNITAVGGSGTFASWNISMAAVGANSAASVSNTPAGNISSTTVQAAINELDSEKLSNAAGAVTSTNLNSIITAATAGSSSGIPVITYDAKGRITAVTTANLSLFSSVNVTTGGTSIEFTGIIPSWANEFTIHLIGVSTNGTNSPMAQIGVGGVYVTAGYVSSAVNFNSGGAAADVYTTGMALMRNAIAANNYSGHMTFKRQNGNTWTAVGGLGANAAVGGSGFGHIAAAGAIDSVRLTTETSTNTFDVNGGVSVSWRA